MRRMRRSRWIVLLGGGLLAAAGWFGWHWHQTRPLRAAREAYDRSDWLTAYSRAESYRRKHPGDDQATRLVVRCLSQLGRCDAAIDLLSRVEQPEESDLRLIASCFVGQGVRGGSRSALERAAELYGRALEQSPRDGEVLQRLAALWVQLDRPGEAIEAATRLSSIPGHARAAHAMLGTIHHGQADWSQACDNLLEVVRLDPELSQGPEPPQSILRMLARSLLHLGRGADAESYLQRVTTPEPDPELLWQLGHARQQQGDSGEAIATWRQAVELAPEYLPALRDLGELELARNRPAAALPWLERAAKLANQDATLRYQLGLAFAQLNREPEATQQFREAERLRAIPIGD